MSTSDLYAIADILGHDADCPSLLADDDPEHDSCDADYRSCSVWQVGELIVSSKNLTKLLASAWDNGFSACQQRVGQQLLNLLPQRIDAENPYSA